MAAKYPEDDKIGVDWLTNPTNMFSPGKDPEAEKKQIPTSAETKKTKSKKKKVKSRTDPENPNGNSPKPKENETVVKKTHPNLETTCFNIVEALIRRFKSKDTAYIELLEKICSLYENQGPEISKLKIDLLTTLMAHLSQANSDDIKTITEDLKYIFPPDLLKKYIVNNDAIIITDPDEITLGFQSGVLTTKGLKKNVLIKNAFIKRCSLEEEALIASKLNHSSFIQILAVNRKLTVIAYEPFQSTYQISLYDALLTERISMTQTSLLDILIQIAKAVEFAHGQKILLGNLQCCEIRVSRSGIIKIVNFDIATYVGDTEGEYWNIVQTPSLFDTPLFSPETMRTKKYSAKTDVWAMGLLCWEIFQLREELAEQNVLQFGPFIFDVPFQLKKLGALGRIRDEYGAYLKCPLMCPKNLYLYFTQKLLNRNPHQRPDFTDIVKTLQTIKNSC